MGRFPTRRLFLQASGFACLGSISRAASDKPNLTFPKQPRDRLAVTSYPFRAYLESPTNPGRKPELPGMDMTAFAGMIAEKFGVFNINPLGDHFRSTEPTYLASFRSSLEKTNSHIVDLGLGGREFYSADENTRKAAVEFGRKWIGIAAEMAHPVSGSMFTVSAVRSRMWNLRLRASASSLNTVASAISL